MMKLDRLGWAAGFSFRAYGLTIGVRTNTAAILDRLITHLPYGWEPSDSPKVDILFSMLVGHSSEHATPATPVRRIGPAGKRRRFNLLYDGILLASRTLDQDELLERFESSVRLRVAEHGKEKGLRPRRCRRLEGAGYRDSRPQLLRQDHSRCGASASRRDLLF
ncbi:MAG: hypothetical protein IPF82_16965 [Blastocatellia bacterium]|nr:hypothetical protein [Blastocatellia bacterium]